MTTPTYRPGTFVWREMMTPDVRASRDFYTKLFGWKVREEQMANGMAYPMVLLNDQPIGGIVDIEMMPKKDIPPHWLSYVSVPNVDEAAAAARSAGGAVRVDPTDIPNVGRFCVLADPLHGYTTAMKMQQGDPNFSMPPPVGMFCWDQLNASAPAVVTKFYQKVYGWSRDGFPGNDQMWIFKAGEMQVASLMKAPPGMPTCWVTYVVVSELAKAKKTVLDLGGKVLVEEEKVPNIGSIAVVNDNVGATIGLFQAL